MKKLFIFVVLSIFVCSVFADLMVPTTKNAVNYNHERTIRVNEDNSREVPEWEFVIDPQSLITNYYDYQPGSYNSTPIQLQPDAMGGIYITFHARETAASTRREYFAYIDASGNVTNVATIGTEDIHEGYSGIDIDPETGDPMVAWHVNVDASVDLEVVFTYDLFHLGSPGLWKAPFVIVDDDLITPNAPADEFIWPYVYIGPSPEADKRRVYVTSNNSNAVGDPSENQLIAYADFDVNDLNAQSELDWTYVTIPLMDDWHMSIPEWRRPNCAMAVSDDGKIAIFGYVITGTGSTEPDMMFCFYNDNYCEGDFTYFEGQAEFVVDSPLNQDGTPAFPDEYGNPHDIYFVPYLCNHMNVIFTDGGTKLRFTGNMNMLIEPDSWYPDIPLMYPKVYTYDIPNDEFSFYELWIRGANPADNQVMVPWDLDEDGVVDNFDPDGYVMWEDGWPIYHFDNGVAFHENTFKMTKNDENDWLLSIWSEGLKSRYGNVPEPGYEDWAEFPEICIAISKNGGLTWEDEILINAKADDDNYAPEIDGMIPCYVYVGDKIEDIGDGWGLVHLFFLDDNSYGSWIQAHGENIGGTMMYAAIKIYFGDTSADPTVTPNVAFLKQNYPNPFNPTTNIAYNMQVPGNVTLEVYNIKGQKVKTLIDEYKNAGNHIITWNGNNDSNQSVASGVYFYKMKVDGKLSSTKKMILMK
jgi:hypothetical protein